MALHRHKREGWTRTSGNVLHHRSLRNTGQLRGRHCLWADRPKNQVRLRSLLMNSNWRFRIIRFTGVVKVMLRSRMAVTGLLILGIYLVLAILAPLFTPYDPNDSIVSGPLARPEWWTYFSEGSHLSQNMALETNPGFYSDP